MDNVEEWERQALDNHNKIEQYFYAGKSGIKEAQLKDGTIRMRIAMHLLETGGGLTANEIASDAKSTEGKEWRNTNADGTPEDINAVIRDMLAPGSNMKRMLESAGGFGLVDYGLAQKMDEQYVLRQEEDRFFLWCQDGVDWGAKLASAKSALAAAEKEAGWVDSLKSQVESSQDKVRQFEEELRDLGLFKFSEKKVVKTRLATAESELKRHRSDLLRSEKAAASLPVLSKEYERARVECKKAIS